MHQADRDVSLFAPGSEHRRPKHLGESWDFDPLLGLALMALVATVVVTLMWSVTTRDTIIDRGVMVSPTVTVDETVPWAPPVAVAAPMTTTSTVPAARWVTGSTNYCESQSSTASGTQPRTGVVAVSKANFARLRGSSWRVLSGPLTGAVVRVEDWGPSAEFDIWVPSCASASEYGRRTITVEAIR